MKSAAQQLDTLCRVLALLEITRTHAPAPDMAVATRLVREWVEDLRCAGACVYCGGPKVRTALPLKADPFPKADQEA